MNQMDHPGVRTPIEMSNVMVDPINRHRVLNKIVGSDREKVGLFG